MNYLSRVFAEKDGTPSAKRIFALWSVALFSAMMILGLFFDVSDNVEKMAETLLVSGLGQFAVGRFAER